MKRFTEIETEQFYGLAQSRRADLCFLDGEEESVWITNNSDVYLLITKKGEGKIEAQNLINQEITEITNIAKLNEYLRLWK